MGRPPQMGPHRGRQGAVRQERETGRKGAKND